ncbi:MAG: Mobile element protein, partial [uncultured Acetobacteraceae bacterium]
GEKAAQAGGDRGQAAPGRGSGGAGRDGGRARSGVRGDGGGPLLLAFGVRRAEVGPGEAAQAAGTGERPPAQSGGGPHPGEAGAQGSRLGKCMVRPSRARAELV